MPCPVFTTMASAPADRAPGSCGAKQPFREFEYSCCMTKPPTQTSDRAHRSPISACPYFQAAGLAGSPPPPNESVIASTSSCELEVPMLSNNVPLPQLSSQSFPGP